MTSRTSRLGAALRVGRVMLFLLIAVAVSFVFLMSQQEGTPQRRGRAGSTPANSRNRASSEWESPHASSSVL